MKSTWLALPLALCLPAVGSAQQKITGPQARYWVSAETQTGFSGMDRGAIMSAMTGGGSAARKSLQLELTGTRDANPAQATHGVPAGLNMGPALELLGERQTAAADRERDIPEMESRPRGRILFFWGCGETAGAGQPVIVDLAQMANGALPANLRSIAVRDAPLRLLNSRGTGYANWPNQRDSKTVPANASLIGAHNVRGNINPEIRFAVENSHDFMDALTLDRAKTGGGALRLSWSAAATATGYFATGFGARQGGAGGEDMVMWNSSSVRMLGGEALMRFLPPAEVARLIRERVVMEPKTTECVVPREVLAAAGGDLVMNSLNGYGPELNVVHPPRPQDPKADWNQEYAVKLRLRSFTSAMAGMEDAGDRPARRARTGPNAGPARDSGTQREGGEEQSETGSPTDAAKSILRGIFGR
jgi:hypothetical protein